MVLVIVSIIRNTYLTQGRRPQNERRRKMLCSYCDSSVEILAYRLGEKMCLDCAKSAFYQMLENGNHVLTVKKEGN
jgi:hypothetical protein